MNKCVGLLLLLTGILEVNGREWHAAPNARLDGDGSLGKPWALQIALTQTALIQPGDMLYLRGGSYRGPGFISSISGTSNNYIVVRSFPGEWAVITDGSEGRLVGNMPSALPYNTTTGVRISGSEFWSPGTVITAESEQIQLNARVNSPTNWTLVRGWNGMTPATHSGGTKIKLRAAFIDHGGSYVMFRDFEIAGTASANRVVNSSNYVGSGLNFSAAGQGNKAINLVIHNVGHPGIGFWSQGAGGEINGCLIWGAGIYDNNGSWIRGSAIYAQNSGGMATIKNCINFRNFTSGGKVYGETGPVLNFGFYSNIVFQCDPSIEGSSGSTSTSNLWYDGNVTLGTPLLSYVSLSNRATYFINNHVINGGFTLKEHGDATMTNNFVLIPKNASVIQYPIFYSSAYYPSNALNITWDYNAYYLGNGASAFQFDYTTADVASVNSAGGGTLRFDNDNGKAWTNWSGFDMHATYSTNWPTNYQTIKVFPNDYDGNRWHIAVINTDTNTTNATLSLSGLGFIQDERYILRDAQDYFHPITTGTYHNVAINLPLNRTNVAVINGTLTHFTNSHTNVRFPRLFNAFVLSRIPSSDFIPQPPRNLRIVGPP